MRWMRSTSARVVAGLGVWCLAGCNLVLGIDDVSSADGPDGGERISAAKITPEADSAANASEDAGKAQ